MSMRTETIFRHDAKKGVRFWYAEIDSDNGRWRGVSGVVGGKPTESGWTQCTPKNVGRSNKTTPGAQAMLEALAEQKKKLDRDYVAEIAELGLNERIKPMLAQSYDDVAVGLPAAVQPKLDGIRALISKKGAFSREGLPLPAADHIVRALQPVFEHDPDIIFDGELYNHELRADFNKISSLCGKSDPEKLAAAREEIERLVQYHIYDAIVPGSFVTRLTRAQSLLMRFAPDSPNLLPLRVVQTVMIATQTALDALYDQFDTAGYEGQIIRALDGEYQRGKRSKLLVKRKWFVTEEYKVLRIEEGNGNWAGAAKRIIFANHHVGGDAEFGAGPRGSREEMRDLFAKRHLYEGGLATVQRMKQLTPGGVPRTPTVVEFHPLGKRLA